MNIKIRPLYNRILVCRLPEKVKTGGGLHIPEVAKEKPVEARVIAIGKGKVDARGKFRPLAVKTGDRVVIGKYSGTAMEIEGRSHLILSEDEVLGIVDGG